MEGQIIIKEPDGSVFRKLTVDVGTGLGVLLASIAKRLHLDVRQLSVSDEARDLLQDGFPAGLTLIVQWDGTMSSHAK
jgi:hypothetical protein